VHKLVTTDNAFIDARLNYETFLLHSLIHASIRELVCINNRWIIALHSIILLVFVT